MSNTMFANASGLPAEDEWTTARDMATLARRLISDFPEDYYYFSVPSFVFHGRVILNHDSELRAYPGADGLKTGYTIASGHNLVTSAMRDGVRLIGVVLGAPSNPARDIRMTALLNDGYQQLGVPVARPVMVANRFGALIPVAHAEELSHPGGRAARVREIAHTQNDSAVWAIQVGLFRSEPAARLAAIRARQTADSGAAHTSPAPLHGRPSWRAQVIGLTGAEAHDACTALARHGMPCVVIRAEAERGEARS
jgi:D-alanyl-D-alanine carboxypeptidase